MTQRQGFIALFLGIAALTALTPAAAGAGVALGARAGLSIAGISGDDNYAPETKLGPGGGLFLTFGVSDLFSIQPEVLYVTKGASWGESEATDENGTPLGTFETLIAVDYLEIPILLRLTPPLGGTIRPVLFAGPTLSFELDEKLKITGEVEQSFGTDDLKNTDFGAAFGLGAELIGAGGIWSLEGRYTLGLTRLNEASSPFIDDVSNWNLLVSIGFARAIR